MEKLSFTQLCHDLNFSNLIDVIIIIFKIAEGTMAVGSAWYENVCENYITCYLYMLF